MKIAQSSIELIAEELLVYCFSKCRNIAVSYQSQNLSIAELFDAV